MVFVKKRNHHQHYDYICSYGHLANKNKCSPLFLKKRFCPFGTVSDSKKEDTRESDALEIPPMTLLGFTLDRMAFHFAFSLVYPLVTAMLLSLNTAYSPHRPGTTLLLATFMFCVVLYYWSKRRYCIYRLFFSANPLTRSLSALYGAHLFVRERLNSRWRQFCIMFIASSCFTSAVLFRQAMVFALQKTPGELTLFGVLFLMNVMLGLLVVY